MSEQNPDNLIQVDVEKEIKQSYLNYAMSVIVSRALPDARDGLKPVHRRLLYSMLELGLKYNTPTKKASRILGAVLANYHPHGPDSAYNALARLSQDFSLRYPLVYGQGNFGSIDGDPPAAYRYTEAKLSHIAEEMLVDIRKNTVDFMLNYDESQKEPTVLPAGLPSLLVNGATGIAVGFTSEIPPHNLREIADAIKALIENPDTSIEDLIRIVKGPDFPTGAIICGTSGIYNMYKNGNGKITLQARHFIEHIGDSERIIFSDIPYGKRKADMIQHLAEQINNELITDVRDIRDESNREGIRVVIELKRGANTDLVLQRIFSLTDFRASYSANFIALVNRKPEKLSLKRALEIYIDHRKNVVYRKTQFELEEAEARAHILRGLLIALNNIDEVITLIKESDTPAIAKERLISTFALDDVQAQAILDMRLHRLTSFETHKIEQELASLEALINDLKAILADPQKVLAIVKETVQKIAQKHGDDRKTEIQENEALSISEEELIDQEDVVISLTESGYIKRSLLSDFGTQKRGGKGKFGITLTKDDKIKHVYVGNTHETMLFVTSLGRAFILKLYQLPFGSRTSRGQSIKSILKLDAEETISSMIYAPPFQEQEENFSLILATKQGKIKRTPWATLTGALTKRGIRIISLFDDDSVIGGIVSRETEDVFLFSKKARVLRFSNKSLRPMGRTARGVKSMKTKANDNIVSVQTGTPDTIFMLLSKMGFGKRLKANQVLPHGRNTSGVTGMGITDKTGDLLIAIPTEDDSTITAMTKKGKTLRIIAKSCAIQGRTARGVSVITVEEDDALTSAVISPIEEHEEV